MEATECTAWFCGVSSVSRLFNCTSLSSIEEFLKIYLNVDKIVLSANKTVLKRGTAISRIYVYLPLCNVARVARLIAMTAVGACLCHLKLYPPPCLRRCKYLVDQPNKK
jgi:hypothetical protein